MDKLSETFNTTFEPVKKDESMEKIQMEITELETKKEKLKEKIKPDITVEDKEYIEFEIKTLIQSNRNILTTLENELTRPGTKASFFEVYAMISNTLLNALKELRGLNETVIHTLIAQRKLELVENKKTPITQQSLNITNNTINMSSSDVFEMIKNAKANSELNEIKADFKLE